ncbi:MAG: 2-amino-4-hydroxy-6-hydroxymethyldihydropteridine diphosphokinase [Desulfotomaculum sp.]|nr:2-amino-4-hydroxy-6-hydroxymethyldihydropteridine diphosphokinase [Desulfotomaculum sp.]MCL0106140.1 2-amino-4-hydroxy-6-hydroxymethyldihydropteridine diphosphokinase [Peptococcaceae bacterium]
MTDKKSFCVYVGLGSNLGYKIQNIFKAIEMIDEHKEIDVLRTAPLYISAPVDYVEQEDFVNTVLEASTSLSPFDLLNFFQDIEKKLKRKRTIRFGPRTIDIDILLYGDLTIETKEIVLPHPRMHERAFVCCPLADLIPNAVLVDKKTVRQLAGNLAKTQAVRMIKKIL